MPTTFYAVSRGHVAGVYRTWEEAVVQMDGFPHPDFESFDDEDEAYAFVYGASAMDRTGAGVNGRVNRGPDLVDMSRSADNDLSCSFEDPEIERAGPHDNLKRDQIKASSPSHRSSSPPPQPHIPGHLPSPPSPPSSSLSDEPTLVDPIPDRPPQVEPDPELSPDQAACLARILAGENIFFTGSAGTGKSLLLRAIIKAFHPSVVIPFDPGAPPTRIVAVTASTGIAALNISGVTLHSWAGCGLAQREAHILVAQVQRNPRLVKRWNDTDVLIVDEISMIHGTLLDKFDKIGRAVRGHPGKPFGGIQLVFSGDFLQLPPVTKDGPPDFAFDAKVWDAAFPRSSMVTLQRVFRQTDAQLVETLERMRVGQLNPADDLLLQSCQRSLECPEGTLPVQLYARRRDVDSKNLDHLLKLPGKITEYVAVDTGFKDAQGVPIPDGVATKLLDDNSRWPRLLEVKVGAQVMLVKNWHSGLVNGSLGEVIGFRTAEEAIKEGMPKDDRIPPGHNWPLVRFNGHKVGSQWKPPQTHLVPSMQLEMENPDGTTRATRVQVPLILAWAMTIHKAQGLTLDRVSVNLAGVFEDGQAYVACSRSTSLSGLQIFNYTRPRVMTSVRVLAWTKEMDDEDEWDRLIANSDFEY